MTVRQFIAIGEAMLEFSGDGGDKWHSGFAGDTLNTAWYFRMQTVTSDWQVDFFTRLGSDAFSDQMLNFLSTNEVGTQFITRDNTRQIGLYLITTTNGERSFTYWRDQSAARLLADNTKHLARVTDTADVIYFSGITLAILEDERRRKFLGRICKARSKGKTIVFDPNIRPRLWADAETMRTDLMAAARVADIVLPSFEDEQSFFGDASLQACAARYQCAGATEIVVKNGGGDMCVATAKSLEIIPAPGWVTPIDTTGAGDAFNGAYLATRLSGKPAIEAVDAAHRVAASVVQHRGALLPMGG